MVHEHRREAEPPSSTPTTPTPDGPRLVVVSAPTGPRAPRPLWSADERQRLSRRLESLAPTWRSVRRVRARRVSGRPPVPLPSDVFDDIA